MVMRKNDNYKSIVGCVIVNVLTRKRGTNCKPFNSLKHLAYIEPTLVYVCGLDSIGNIVVYPGDRDYSFYCYSARYDISLLLFQKYVLQHKIKTKTIIFYTKMQKNHTFSCLFKKNIVLLQPFLAHAKTFLPINNTINNQILLP